MWTHKCKVYNNVVDIEADRPCYWCGLTQETAEQLSNEHINENIICLDLFSSTLFINSAVFVATALGLSA